MINDNGYISRRDAIKLAEEEEAYGHISVYDLSKLPAVDFAANWTPCIKKTPDEDGVYLVYAPDYSGGSSSSKECYKGIMFSKFKNGKWSIEVGYYKRSNCVKAWMPLPGPCVRNC